MVPPAGSVSPARVLVSVVLPAPLRPTRPIRSPGCTRKVTFCSRARAPARSSRSVTVITGGPSGRRRAEAAAGLALRRRQCTLQVRGRARAAPRGGVARGNLGPGRCRAAPLRGPSTWTSWTHCRAARTGPGDAGSPRRVVAGAGAAAPPCRRGGRRGDAARDRPAAARPPRAPPAPPGASRLFGTSGAAGRPAGARPSWRRLRAQFGAIPVARVFSPGLPPARWDDDPVLAALGDGSSVVYSF